MPLWVLLFLFSCDTEQHIAENNSENNVRIITLAPHLAELIYSAGAIDNLVGVTSYSDFPEQVNSIKKIGDAFKLDYEAIISLRPDYILSWKGGTPVAVVEKLQSFGMTVIDTEIATLADIVKVVTQIAELTHTQEIALKNTQQFTSNLQQLRNRHYHSDSLFIEINSKPLYTVSGKHWISEAVAVCNYKNIFTDLSQISAPISLESVISNNPQTILNISPNEDSQWQNWPKLEAVKNKQIITIHPDLFSRPSFRILIGISKLCEFKTSGTNT